MSNMLSDVNFLYYVKTGKFRPRTANEGPENDRCSSTLSLTSTLHGVDG